MSCGAAIRNYHAYQGIADRLGAFTVSVFAAIGDVTESEIVAATDSCRSGCPS
jgi:hypothetical protein